MKFNYHTHSQRCGHGSGVEEEYILAAIEAGFDVIGISEHMPYTGRHIAADRMPIEDWDDYIATLKHLKEKYKNQIDVKIGVEFEYYPNHIEHLKKLQKDVEYMICGQHEEDMYGHDYTFACSDEDVPKYANLVVEAIESGMANIIAHPDYFMSGRDGWSEACSIAARKICEASKKHNIPLELNLSGIRHGKREYNEGQRYRYPYYEFWQIASEVKCPVIYGYDAHNPKTLLEEHRIDIINEIIAGLDLNILDEFRIG